MTRSPTFALVGAAGFVARRHLDAIRSVGGELVAALDPHDSVGQLDSYWPECRFFTEPERFDRHLNKNPGAIDYVVVCSPNWLHDAHCRWALRAGCHAICEKPLVLHERNIDQLQRIEEMTGRRVFPILQLRYHPQIAELKAQIEAEPEKWRDRCVPAGVTYITRRGRWYDVSWKGKPELSGGIITNLGIHFFDMMTWLFGSVRVATTHELTQHRASGRVRLDGADVLWKLSTSYDDLPEEAKEAGRYAYRDLQVDGKPVADYSQGFTALHNTVYAEILAGRGLTTEDARAGVSLVERLRTGGGQ